jgi:hypothetical protein
MWTSIDFDFLGETVPVKKLPICICTFQEIFYNYFPK